MQFNGLLLGTEFLAENVKEFEEWRLLSDERVKDAERSLLTLFQSFLLYNKPNEAVTKSDLIEKVMIILGWTHFLLEQNLSQKGRSDVPDYALFPNAESKDSANAEKEAVNRYRHAVAFLEAKAYDKPLDRVGENQRFEAIPSSQILRYLTQVDTQTNGKVQWGILTNGRIWRIYYNRARSKSEEYFEIDLLETVGLFETELPLDMFAEALYGNKETMRRHYFKLFLLFFSPSAFAQNGDGLVDDAVAEARYWEAQVAATLRQTVFDEVYPQTLEAIYLSDPDKPEELTPDYQEILRVNGLYLLYRLLFICYAEDRDLLPVSYPNYRAMSLQEEVRKPVAKNTDDRIAFSQKRTAYFDRLAMIAKTIDEGDEAAGVPPYNGGLFNVKNAPLLEQIKISDALLAPVIDKLSRRAAEKGRKWINYRDMGVQQLGSIYEGLLEFEPQLDEGKMRLTPNIFARKVSGSFYTPQPIVTLLLEKSIGVYVKQFTAEFKAKVTLYQTQTNLSRKDRNAKLQAHDPAAALLNIRILDPAMGSGHFLVSVVDLLADEALVLLTQTPGWIPWQADEPYVSPLTLQMSEIKNRILALAKENRWRVEELRLEERRLARRIALKRCVYGVDKNGMAVELAKVALWLHTFTVGAPLSFLDHHIRWGDSLFGQWVGKTIAELSGKSGGLLFIQNEIGKARASAQAMEAVEVLSDADMSEVQQSMANFEIVKELTAPLDAFLRLYLAFKWVIGKDKLKKTYFNNFRLGTYGNVLEIATGKAEPQNATPLALELFAEARKVAKEEGFVNWEVAFPGIWTQWQNPTPIGGFQLVVGNPPWERMKLQQVEWFAQRKTEIAMQNRAADREKMIKALQKADDPLWEKFEEANKRTETAMKTARDEGEYPLLSGGDTNYYSLFVERAHHLACTDGAIGIVCPSGIAADKTASEYFRSVTTTGRLLYFYDFENKKILFPDVDSRFKFCILIAQNPDREPVAAAELCFFIQPKRFEGPQKLKDKKQLEHFKAEIEARGFTMTAQDFALVNPNTGTAPIFRTQRDAEITLRIYGQFPVLFDHTKEQLYPIKHFIMFDVSNDSHLFIRVDELEKEGFYPSGLNRFKKGRELFFPLYEGKMVQMYNHRAKNVFINPGNLFRPAQQEDVSLKDLQNVNFYPTPQYFVSENKITEQFDYALVFKKVTAPTNMRTMICSIIPTSAFSYSLKAVLILDKTSQAKFTAFLQANFASFIYDFVLRQKVPGQNLATFLIEQIPVIPPETYANILSGDYIEKRLTVGDFVREEVLRLTYTAWDMQAFAQELGYEGPPFVWDAEDRYNRMARLDALYFLLYGCDEDEIRNVMDTFPIVKEKDEKEFGRYRTCDLILNYFRALKAGDTDVWIQG